MSKPPELTDRMKEVLEGIAKGQTNQEIAATLGISRKTIEKHRDRLYSAFRVDNAVSLVLTAIRMKVIPL